MSGRMKGPGHGLWARLRFSVVGPLLASPPAKGRLHEALEKLAAKQWVHPISGQPAYFQFSSIERWYYRARNEAVDPVGALRRKVRSDAGVQHSVSDAVKQALANQYRQHPGWSMQLHADNIRAAALTEPKLGAVPQYGTLRRYMKANGLLRQRRHGPRGSASAQRAADRLEQRETRCFEAEYVHGLWHLDFHVGSLKVILNNGEWATPQVLGVLDDRSRLVCHLQWYLTENTENLSHGLQQAFLKRGLPRSILMDNGSAMLAHETINGLGALSVIQDTTLPYSPQQNGNQENFWVQVEGRLLAMLEGEQHLTLAMLNHATQAWVEMEYNREVHSETGQTPLARMLSDKEVSRRCPDPEHLRMTFTAHEDRTVRRSDGTISIGGVRFEIPGAYRTLERVTVHFASWDLSVAYLYDALTGRVLCKLHPQDLVKNASGMRRSLEPPTPQPVVQDGGGVAPLLKKLMADYAQTGLVPAYLPKDDTELS